MEGCPFRGCPVLKEYFETVPERLVHDSTAKALGFVRTGIYNSASTLIAVFAVPAGGDRFAELWRQKSIEQSGVCTSRQMGIGTYWGYSHRSIPSRIDQKSPVVLIVPDCADAYASTHTCSSLSWCHFEHCLVRTRQTES